MNPDLCADCSNPAAFKCYGCGELVCAGSCLDQHRGGLCPSEEPDERGTGLDFEVEE